MTEQRPSLETIETVTLLGGDAAVCGPDGCELPSVTTSERVTAAETVDPAAESDPAASWSEHVPVESGFGGAASFADAESREILNLLGGGGGAADGCCGGSCCA